MDKKKLYYLEKFFLCLFVALLFYQPGFGVMIYNTEAIEGKPETSYEYPHIYNSILQVIECDENIYVLHRKTDGLLQVYDLEGGYQKTLFFKTDRKNGAYMITEYDEKLMVMDKLNNIYVVSNGKVLEFVEEEKVNERFPGLQFEFREITNGYSVKGLAVFRDEGGMNGSVIPTPPGGKLVEIRPYIAFFIGLLIVICRWRISVGRKIT